MSRAATAEIIELVSDDDDDASPAKDNKPIKICSNCINFQCDSGVSLKPAPSFACAFYGVNPVRKRKRLICKKCFNIAMEHQEKLATALLNKTPILKCEFPDHTMEVEISDSEDSDQEKKEDLDDQGDYLPEDVLLNIEQMMDSAMTNVLQKYDIDYQITASHEILKTEWDRINERNQELDGDITSMIKKMDTLRNSLYSGCVPEIKMLEDLQIHDPPIRKPMPNAPPIISPHSTPKISTVTPKRMSAGSSSFADSEVTPLHAINRSLGFDIPPQGPFTKQFPELDSKVFVMKHPLMPWIRGKVHQVVQRVPIQCRVRLSGRRSNGTVRTVNGKHIALAAPSSVVIPVATRVVAVFLDANSSDYYSGVIAEPPKSTNKYRYLVFFDDGYAQYVLHKFICIVCESSPRVWEDIPEESRDFVKKYLETYPERPMVKLLPGQIVKTEWNGKWWIARVVQVDGSLVQMHFDADDRTEWIYRGSARLGPLYLELLKANARQQGGHHAAANTPSRHRLPTHKTNAPYVEYTSFNPELENEQPNEASVAEAVKLEPNAVGKAAIPAAASPATPAPPQSRAVAKKSTTRRQSTADTGVYVPTTETKPSHSIVYYQTQNKIQTRKFVVHKCGPHCVKGITFTPDDLKGYSPLSIPLLCGWNRQLCKFPKGKKVTLYQAPCGVRLRNMEELHKYLRVTRSPMSVDLFDFDHWVHCLAEFVLDKCFVNIKDLSYGVENVPIPCVNEIDHALPDTIRYSTQREPTEGVHINRDPEFLCSCDCTDDCQDKTKCQCWQLTIQGATLGGRVPNNAVGYVYKRLPEPVTTGIYECNSRCKCSVKTCLNRVVQHPLTLKLQVFKTAPRGWGIRCLNDIPLGSFICIYAGRLLTEQGANEGGKNYGDEYLAELDYVEVVEGIKEGYESDVLDPEQPLNDTPSKEEHNAALSDDEVTGRKTGGDSDEDFNIKLHKGYGELELESESPTSIRKRLRKRKKSEENSGQDGSEDRSEDGSVTKGSESSTVKSTNQDNREEILISDDEDGNTKGRREPSRFEPNLEPTEVTRPTLKSVRDFFGEDEAVYIMDAKTTGNIGRYLNHSCDPNVFVQNVFVDTHDVRFPWVAFFALNYIRAGQELTWNYSYDVGSIPGKVIICRCGASNCRGRLL